MFAADSPASLSSPRAAKKNDFAKSKFLKFKTFFFPPRRQATLSWLGGFAFMRTPHKGHQEPGIRAGACASKHGVCLVFASLGVLRLGLRTNPRNEWCLSV